MISFHSPQCWFLTSQKSHTFLGLLGTQWGSVEIYGSLGQVWLLGDFLQVWKPKASFVSMQTWRAVMWSKGSLLPFLEVSQCAGFTFKLRWCLNGPLVKVSHTFWHSTYAPRTPKRFPRWTISRAWLTRCKSASLASLCLTFLEGWRPGICSCIRVSRGNCSELSFLAFGRHIWHIVNRWPALGRSWFWQAVFFSVSLNLIGFISPLPCYLGINAS